MSRKCNENRSTFACRLCYSAAGQGGFDLDDGLITARLGALRLEHRDLDAAIVALGGAGAVDQIQLARLKKRKLRLRDEITLLEDQLIPDIIA